MSHTTSEPANILSDIDQAQVRRIVCSKCGCSSTLPEYFTNVDTEPRCPRCSTHKQQRVSATSLLVGVIAGFCLFLLFTLRGTGTSNTAEPRIEVLVLNGIAFFLLTVSPILIILHELAHLVMTVGLGGRVALVTIGIEPFRFKKKIRNTYVYIGSSPWNSTCYCTFPTTRRIILRAFLVRIAGLLLHLILILLLLPYAGLSNLWTTFAWRETLLIANVVLLINNAIPRKIITAFGPLSTDGAALIQILRGELSVQAIHIEDFAIQAGIAIQEKRYEAALIHSEAGLALYPESLRLLDTSAISFMMLHRTNEAISRYKTLFNSPEMSAVPGLQQALYYNNAGWIALIDHEASNSFAFAKQWIQQSFQMAPWLVYIRGTYGGLLIEQGEYEQGIAYVSEVANEIQAMHPASFETNIGENFAYCSIGHKGLGNDKEANDYLQKAIQYAPQAMIVMRAQRIVRDSSTA